MKKMKLIGILIITVLAASGVRAESSDAVRQALQAATADVQASLEKAGLGKDNISLLPIGDDQDSYVQGLLKNAVTAAGLSYVEHGNDPMWSALLAELAWDERKGDMLDSSTLVKFGQLKGAQLLMYGDVREVTETAGRVFVELELHLTSVTTKQHLWGGVFAKRYYLPGDVQGIIDLDPEVRKVIKKAFEGVSDSINQSSKLGGISNVAVVPLAGDIDGYVKSLAVDMLSATRLNPKELDVVSLSEARVALRDKAAVADAVLFGAVRDLSRKLKHDEVLKDVYEINTEVQLTLQSAATGDVLWSKTLSAEGIDEEIVTKGEVAKSLLENGDTKKYALIAVAVVVGLIVLGMFFKAVSRPR